MAAPARSAALKVNWAQITSSLGLKGQTVTSLQSFKKRNEDARRKVNALSEAPQEIDFARYRTILTDHSVVDEIQKSYNLFRPETYDIEKQVKTIEKFEEEAIKNAQETKEKVDAELKNLEETLKNIEGARPFEDLTVDDVAKARPDIDVRTAEMVSKGRWMPAGYKEKFGDLALM